MPPSLGGDFMQSLSSFLISLAVVRTLDYMALKRGGIKVIVWREDERVSQKVKGELALFMGELTTQVFFQNYLPISASFGLKRVI